MVLSKWCFDVFLKLYTYLDTTKKYWYHNIYTYKYNKDVQKSNYDNLAAKVCQYDIILGSNDTYLNIHIITLLLYSGRASKIAKEKLV